MTLLNEQEPPARSLISRLSVWYAIFGGVAAWTVHLVALASLVQWTIDEHTGEWPLHLITGVTVAITLHAIYLSARMWRSTRGADEESDTEAGQLHFLGMVGLLVGAISLALILIEGIYVIPLYSRA
jgi:ammonia channel protein AmtB